MWEAQILNGLFFPRPPPLNFCQRRFSSIYGHSMRKKIINKDIHTRNSAQKRQSKYISSRWANPVISMLWFFRTPNRFHAFKIEINMTHESKFLKKNTPSQNWCKKWIYFLTDEFFINKKKLKKTSKIQYIRK